METETAPTARGKRTATRKPGVQRRAEIARAALAICGERGAAALTTSSIATAVGLSTGALFRHFATLDDILREATDRALAEIETTFPDPTGPPLDRLFDLAARRVRLLRRDAGLAWMLRADEAGLTLPPDALGKLRAVVARSHKFVLTALADGVRDGSVRREPEVGALAVTVMGTIHALAGASGLRGQRRGITVPDPARVLEGLRTLLAASPSVD